MLLLAGLRIWFGIFAAIIFLVGGLIVWTSTSIEAGLVPVFLVFFVGMALLALALTAFGEKRA